jgi:hypothetical protein
MFFRSSSPLRTEAENWFLSELRGRYDVVLKFIARRPGASHGDIEAYVRSVSVQTAEQVGGYLRVLVDRYRMLERRQPVFAKPEGRKGRYYVRDNFLRAWLDALQSPVSAINFKPEGKLVESADSRLMDSEGHGLERLAAQLYEERSRKGLGDFPLSHRIEGYWDRADTEIDLVALDDEGKRIRFGSCKRNADKLVSDLSSFDGHIDRFLKSHAKYRSWTIEKVAIAPVISEVLREAIEDGGYQPQDLHDLTEGL